MRIDTLEYLLLNDPQFAEAWVEKEMEDCEDYFMQQLFEEDKEDE